VDQLQSFSHRDPLDDFADFLSIKLGHHPKKISGPSPPSQQANHNTAAAP
jgi:hypothetical protein